MLFPYNGGAGLFLLDKLCNVLPLVQRQQVVQLHLQLPLTFFISSVLSEIWNCRKQKKPCHLHPIRAALEAGVNILRKSRPANAAIKLAEFIEI